TPSPPRRPTMRHANRGALRDQVNFLRRQFLQDGDLPFTDVLTEGVIERALATLTGWLDRIFSPLVTLWVFLGQVLSADHSCRARPRVQPPAAAGPRAARARARWTRASLSPSAAGSAGLPVDEGRGRGWLGRGRLGALSAPTTGPPPAPPNPGTTLPNQS